MKNTGGVDLCQAHARFDMKFNLHLQYLKINRATNTCKEHILFFKAIPVHFANVFLRYLCVKQDY